MGKRDTDKRRGIAVAGTWVPLPHAFTRSRACAELSPHAAKLLFDLLSLLGPNASRNGDLSITPKVMALRGWSGRETLNATVRELMDCGLLVQTHQGSRLDCSLWALTLYPLDCDLSKLDVQPGCYTSRDFERAGLAAPTEVNPAKWRRARKTVSLTPPRDEVSEKRPATGQTKKSGGAKSGSSSRCGTKTPVSDVSSVPPRVTFIDMPSIGATAEHPTKPVGIDGDHTTDQTEQVAAATDQPLKAKTPKSPTSAPKTKPAPKVGPVEKTALGLSREAAEVESDVVRVRDDLPAGYWCEELGEYIKPKPTGPSPETQAMRAALKQQALALKLKKVAEVAG